MTAPAEILSLVSGSGNSFHSRVARWLHAQGWHVVVSPYYMDQTQNKAREIDLVAEKAWPVTDMWGHRAGDVVIRLYVECKFVPTYSVFWFTEKNMQSARELVCTQTGFQTDNMYTNGHHYLAHSKRVAKLFATPVSKNSETDPYYKALSQVLNATVAMRGGPVTLPALQRRGRGALAVLEMPVVVCSSFAQMYGVDFYADSPPEIVTDNFQLEVQYAYLDRAGEQRNQYLLLDFVEYDKLADFMALLHSDGEAAAFFAEQENEERGEEN